MTEGQYTSVSRFITCNICGNYVDRASSSITKTDNGYVHKTCLGAEPKRNSVNDQNKSTISLNDINVILATLRKQFPHGHPHFINLTLDELDLHNRKNKDYAKGGDPLGNFNRVANILAQYPNFPIHKPIGVAIVYMLKQLDAAMWMLSQGYEGEVEGVDERLTDIHVYGKIERCILKDEKERKK
jgi:hypothetical protein